MNGQTSEALLSLFDSTRLRPRYWVNFSLLSLITVLEFFDFAIVAFLLAVLGPQWHLTYGQSAIILYSGGVGAICGAVAWVACQTPGGARASSYWAHSSAGSVRVRSVWCRRARGACLPCCASSSASA